MPCGRLLPSIEVNDTNNETVRQSESYAVIVHRKVMRPRLVNRTSTHHLGEVRLAWKRSMRGEAFRRDVIASLLKDYRKRCEGSSSSSRRR